MEVRTGMGQSPVQCCVDSPRVARNFLKMRSFPCVARGEGIDKCMACSMSSISAERCSRMECVIQAGVMRGQTAISTRCSVSAEKRVRHGHV